MPCIFCDNTDDFEVVSKETRDSAAHVVRKCRRCALTQLDPVPGEAQAKAYYDDNVQQESVEPNISLADKARKTAADTARRRSLVTGLLGGAESFLDFGCGYGFLVAGLREAGLDAWGFEPGRRRSRTAAEVVGVPLLPVEPDGPVSGAGPSFDCIGLFQVLEHIAAPVRTLCRLRELGHPRTRLVVEVPNLDDHMVETCPEYRAFYWQQAHVAYYDPKTLRAVLAAAGWTVDRLMFVQRYSVMNAMVWLVRGEPQLRAPAYEAPAQLRWLDACYRSHLAEAGRTDTIVALAHRDGLP